MNSLPFKLRILKPADKYSIAKHMNNIKIWNQVRDYLPHPYSERDAEKYIDFALGSKPGWNLGITIDDEVIGMITTMAIKEMTRIGFQEFKLHRIYSEVFEYNQASKRALAKNGYRQEAILKEAAVKNDQLLDLYIYARLSHE